MNTHKIRVLTLLAVLSVLPGLHTAQEVTNQGEPNHPWFRIHDLEDTSTWTQIKWATQELFASEKLERVRHLYGYDLQVTCKKLENMDSQAADKDIGIAALVTKSEGKHAKAWKLEPLKKREDLSVVAAFCEGGAGNEETTSMEWRGLLSSCSQTGPSQECFIATGFRIPVAGLEPARDFWTESGVVERQATPGWIQDSDWNSAEQQELVYVYDNAVTREAIGVLPRKSSVQLVKDYRDDSGNLWTYAIPGPDSGATSPNALQ